MSIAADRGRLAGSPYQLCSVQCKIGGGRHTVFGAIDDASYRLRVLAQHGLFSGHEINSGKEGKGERLSDNADEQSDSGS